MPNLGTTRIQILNNNLRRHEKFLALFKGMHQSLLDIQTNSSHALQSANISAIGDNSFDVEFFNVTLRFTFVLGLNDVGALFPKVVVHQVKPRFDGTLKLLGNFTFNGQGETDFDESEYGPHNIVNLADRILSYYLVEALRYQ